MPTTGHLEDYIDGLAEETSPNTAADMLLLRSDADGLMYKIAPENLISGLPSAFGAGVIKTLSSDVASAGTDRHLIIAAQTSTTDNLIEITGLNAGEEVIIRADSGDTITVKHNDAGATDKILLYNEADIALTGDQTLKLVKIASGKVVQYVDEEGGGGGSTATLWLARKLYDNTISGSATSWNIQESDLTAGSGTFASYDKLELIVDNLRSSASATNDVLYLLYGTGGGALDSTASNYGSQFANAQGSSPGGVQGDTPSIAGISGNTSSANYNSAVVIEVLNPGASTHKRAISRNSMRFDTSTAHQVRLYSHVWENTGAIDRIGIRTDNDPTDLLAIGGHLIIIGYKNVTVSIP